jgi:hypothetical protein
VLYSQRLRWHARVRAAPRPERCAAAAAAGVVVFCAPPVIPQIYAAGNAAVSDGTHRGGVEVIRIK